MSADFDRTIELKVTGMTCGHCVMHVTEELNTIPTVSKVSVTLGSPSSVLIVTDEDIADDVMRAAVDEAGDYEVVDIIR